MGEKIVMTKKKWDMRNGHSEHVAQLADALGLSSITATVLVNRGIRDVESARQWLSLDSPDAHDPFQMADMAKAVDRLHYAITQQEKICCYGDYDVDGISATSLYVLFLRQQEALVDFYIPDRQSEGYGLHEAAVQRIARAGVKVLVTIDCGTSSHKEIALAQDLGLDVIITDHHQILGEHPRALAFLNPQRTDCQYPFKGLCSGGLALKVATAYTMKYGPSNGDVSPYTDLAALATVADMVPLQDENRWIVREGLQRIADGTRYGIHALKQSAGINGVCTESMVAFRLAPAINAAGRLAHARLGVELFTSDKVSHAFPLARQLDELNRQRRVIEQETVSEAIKMIHGEDLPGAIVVGDRAWHVGVVGIVASRLVERYYRPSVVVSFDEHGYGRGSVRSVPGLNVCKLLAQCSDLLEGFGGHPAAAGLQVRQEQFSAFQQRLSDLASSEMDEANRYPVVYIDAAVRLQHVHPQLIRELEQLHPFGMGNPEPVFLGQHLKVLESRIVGGEHLKLVVRQEGSVPFECMGFRMGALEHCTQLENRMIDMVFVPEINRWNGMDRIQLRICDVRMKDMRGASLC
ncbi:MAG: single-stranded-DNA-specific exonuclease RecJ [Nitrospirales bacterium]|nr:MAG: single-stranded-DNA-specific exonuclease RecJ [Nitrospirales bacterium]